MDFNWIQTCTSRDDWHISWKSFQLTYLLDLLEKLQLTSHLKEWAHFFWEDEEYRFAFLYWCPAQSSWGRVLLPLWEVALGEEEVAGGKKTQFSYPRDYKTDFIILAMQSRRKNLFHLLLFPFSILALRLPWLIYQKSSRETLARGVPYSPSPRGFFHGHPWILLEISPFPSPRNYLGPDNSLGPARNLQSSLFQNLWVWDLDINFFSWSSLSDSNM